MIALVILEVHWYLESFLENLGTKSVFVVNHKESRVRRKKQEFTQISRTILIGLEVNWKAKKHHLLFSYEINT